MTTSENLFIFVSLSILLILLFVVKKIPWKKLGFTPTQCHKGWLSIILFSIGVFILVQVFINFLKLPAWVMDKDPLIPLLVIVFLQEYIFRGILITWLERWGKQKALWISTILFGSIHLVQPGAWLITALSFIGGYFWGWHFLKFRNIYLLSLSHLIVNLSFNYVLFSLFFK
jgi:membrane protease YdiL (CAAX protease family)